MYYGFDIGGTKIEFAAFNKKLQKLVTERIPTPSNDYQKLLKVISELVVKYDHKFAAKGAIGIGIPGIEGRDDGLTLTVNIPAANGKPLRADLQSLIGRPVSIENDANCFALSEALDEDLIGDECVMGVILGTGFGGGFIYSGKVFSGHHHIAGEIGHNRLPIDAWFHLGENAPLFSCGCGQKGCLDNYLSGRGFEQLYCHYYGIKKTALAIIDDYRHGEANAIEHVQRFLELLAICLAGIFTTLDPDVVVLGGGLSNFDLIYKELPERIAKYLLPVAKCPRIIKAKYGDSGGVRGAAFLNAR